MGNLKCLEAFRWKYYLFCRCKVRETHSRVTPPFPLAWQLPTSGDTQGSQLLQEEGRISITLIVGKRHIARHYVIHRISPHPALNISQSKVERFWAGDKHLGDIHWHPYYKATAQYKCRMRVKVIILSLEKYWLAIWRRKSLERQTKIRRGQRNKRKTSRWGSQQPCQEVFRSKKILIKKGSNYSHWV